MGPLMAATVVELKTARRRIGNSGVPTVRAAIGDFVGSPKIKGNANTLRAYTNVLNRTAETIGPGRKLAEVDDTEIGDALIEAGLARRQAALRCPAQRNDSARTTTTPKAMSRSRIDRLCRRRDIPQGYCRAERRTGCAAGRSGRMAYGLRERVSHRATGNKRRSRARKAQVRVHAFPHR